MSQRLMYMTPMRTAQEREAQSGEFQDREAKPAHATFLSIHSSCMDQVN